MAEEGYSDVAYCNRCDKAFMGLSDLSQKMATDQALALLEEHVVKHEDYVPELHSEIDE